MKPRIDFDQLAAVLVARAEPLVEQWLPGGKWVGAEYQCADLSGGRGGSCSVNARTGKWADFATDQRGADLTSLYAAVRGLSQIDAARELVEQLGILPPAIAKPKSARTEWVAIRPVPPEAGAPPVAHYVRGRPERTYRYQDAQGRTLGYVYRFRTSNGGKDDIPLTWARDPGGQAEWRWLSFAVPRPLYGLHQQRAHLPVLVVEGEKCRDAACVLLGEHFDVYAWPGGGKAVGKADFSTLAGREVVLWPDCDAKRDRATQALLDEFRQPGIVAMERAAIALAAAGARSVQIVAIPPPGAEPDGWDVADAIDENGWGTETLLAFIRGNLRAPAPERLEQDSAPAAPGASAAPTERWRAGLVETKSGPKDCRENVITILQKHPGWAGALAYDDFSKAVVVRKPTPLGQAPGQAWDKQQTIELGLWLSAQLGLQVRALETFDLAIGYVARLQTFHPVRDLIEAVHWDGQPRVQTWAPRLLGADDTAYHRRVGELFLINLLRRIYDPGCVMRSVMVLEGRQNAGKSLALATLARPWYSDTMFRVGDKDAYLQLQGTLLYEISELESFNRSEATAVKAFISSVEDRFRAPYDTQPARHPRQVTFAATTNADEYLKDWSGNTRFWPCRIGARVDLDGIAREREQLFAEALTLVRAGARGYPEREEFEELFEPEQQRRLVPHPWTDMIETWLAAQAMTETTVGQVLTECLKFDRSRISPNGLEAQRVGQALQSLGWQKRRPRLGGARPWKWCKPEGAGTPASAEPAASADAGGDDVPF